MVALVVVFDTGAKLFNQALVSMQPLCLPPNFYSIRHIGPTGVYLLDFFCSGIQFNLLLSPYPCFISLLYLDLYVLGDDALIS